MFNSLLQKLFKPIHFFWYGTIFTIVFIIDRLSKGWALKTLAVKDMPIFPGFTLSLSINHGISFNLLSTTSKQGTLCLISFISIIFAAFMIHAIIQHKHKIGLLPEFLVLAGAASNLCDRIIYGGVIDFLLLYVADWHWPTFNIADCAIFSGIVLIFIRSLCDSKN